MADLTWDGPHNVKDSTYSELLVRAAEYEVVIKSFGALLDAGLYDHGDET
jgi:hypothetical protein